MRFRGAIYRPPALRTRSRSGIAMVHQHFSLVHDMTVVDNVILGQQRGFVNTKAWAQRLERWPIDYGFTLDPYAKIEDLSVGERQRVEIVKCLIREPRLFVLDEPTAVLLPDEIAALLDVCRRVAAERRAPWCWSRTSLPRSRRRRTVSPCCAAAAWSPRSRSSGRGNRRAGARDDPGRRQIARQIGRLDARRGRSRCDMPARPGAERNAAARSGADRRADGDR